jgi:hypothetical protein
MVTKKEPEGSTQAASDRRTHPRYSTRVELQGTPDQGGVVARMVARNLSLSGLYCSSTADFAEMTRLAIRLLLPGNNGDAESLDLEAVVVRRRKLPSASGEPRYELALFFTGLDNGMRRRLGRFLATR